MSSIIFWPQDEHQCCHKVQFMQYYGRMWEYLTSKNYYSIPNLTPPPFHVIFNPKKHWNCVPPHQHQTIWNGYCSDEIYNLHLPTANWRCKQFFPLKHCYPHHTLTSPKPHCFFTTVKTWRTYIYIRHKCGCFTLGKLTYKYHITFFTSALLNAMRLWTTPVLVSFYFLKCFALCFGRTIRPSSGAPSSKLYHAFGTFMQASLAAVWL